MPKKPLSQGARHEPLPGSAKRRSLIIKTNIDYSIPAIPTTEPLTLSTDTPEQDMQMSDSTTEVREIELRRNSDYRQNPGLASPIVADVSNYLALAFDTDDVGSALTAVNSGHDQVAIVEPDWYGWDAEWDRRHETSVTPIEVDMPDYTGLKTAASSVSRTKSRKSGLFRRVLSVSSIHHHGIGEAR